MFRTSNKKNQSHYKWLTYWYLFYLFKVEVEQALVEAEMESEAAGLQQEKDALEALHNKMADLELKSQKEKEKVLNRLGFIVNQ